MKPTLAALLIGLLSSGSVMAQSTPSSPPATATPAAPSPNTPTASSTPEAQASSNSPDSGDPQAIRRQASAGRPDAVYPHPSGQDSQPSTTHTKGRPQRRGARDSATVESRGTRTNDQSKPAQSTAAQKAYGGSSGKKADPGTACSTARPAPNGGVDCGTGGNGATPGKVPK